MAKSKDYVFPIFPKDLMNNIREGQSASGADFTPGTLVVRVNNLLVACDTDTATHSELPCEMVWTDGSTRVDGEEVYLRDGTVVQQHTTLCQRFIAECATSLFDNAPAAGDVLMKSSNAGKISNLTAAAYETLVDTNPEQSLEVIGRLVGAGDRRGTGFWLCHFDLG